MSALPDQAKRATGNDMGRPERNFPHFCLQERRSRFSALRLFCFLFSGENEGRCLRHGAFVFSFFGTAVWAAVRRRFLVSSLSIPERRGCSPGMEAPRDRQCGHGDTTRRSRRQPRQHTVFASSDLLTLDRYTLALPVSRSHHILLTKTWKFLALERMMRPLPFHRPLASALGTAAPRCRTCRKAKLLTCNAPIRRPNGPISSLRPSVLPPIRGMMFMSSTGQLPDSRRTSSPAARASCAGPGKARHDAGTEDHCREGAEDIGADRAIFRRPACIDSAPRGPSGSVADAGPRPRP